jgi:hypothetical protein
MATSRGFHNALVALTPGVLSIIGNFTETAVRELDSETERRVVKVQIILQAHATMSAVLHSFDIPSCAVAFDGEQVFMTTLGAFAHVFRANIVEPAYRSKTFEVRLCKYFGRGFALVLPGLRDDAFRGGEHLELPHLWLEAATARGRLVYGAAAPMTLAQASYYVPEGLNDVEAFASKQRWRDATTFFQPHSELVQRLNVASAATGKSEFVVVVVCDRPDDALACFDNSAINLRKFATRGPPTLSSLLPRAQFVNALDMCIAGLDIRDTKPRYAFMHPPNTRDILRSPSLMNTRLAHEHAKHVFGLTDNEFVRLVGSSYVAMMSHTRSTPLTFNRAFESRRAAAIAAYDAACAGIEWWVSRDAYLARSAAANPDAMTCADWCGAAWRGDAAPQCTLDVGGLWAQLLFRHEQQLSEVLDNLAALEQQLAADPEGEQQLAADPEESQLAADPEEGVKRTDNAAGRFTGTLPTNAAIMCLLCKPSPEHHVLGHPCTHNVPYKEWRGVSGGCGLCLDDYLGAKYRKIVTCDHAVHSLDPGADAAGRCITLVKKGHEDCTFCRTNFAPRVASRRIVALRVKWPSNV